MLELILLCLLGILTRLPFIASESDDDWVTWWLIKKHRDASLNYNVRDSVFPGVLAGPQFNYFLLSLLPKRLWGPVGNFANIVYDLLAIIIVYGAALAAFAALEMEGTILGVSYPAMVGLLFVTSPILHPVTARLTGVKSRTMGGVLFLGFFVCAGALHMNPDLHWGLQALLVCGAVGCAVLAFISSAFALQGILLIGVLLAVFLLDIRLALLLVVSMGVGYLIPKINLRAVLAHKFAHYRWFLKSNFFDKGAMSRVAGRNDWRDFVRLPVFLIRNPTEFAEQILRKNSYIIALYSVPPLWVGVYYFFSGSETESLENPFFQYALALTAAATVIFVFTSMRKFQFLGEAERYYELSIGFVCFLFVSVAAAGLVPHSVVMVVVMFQVAMIFVALVFRLRRAIAASLKPPMASPSLDELLAALEKDNRPLRVLTIPVKLSFVLSYNGRGHDWRFYYVFLKREGETAFDYMLDDLVEYNWPRADLEYFKEMYGIDTLVVRKDSIDKLKRRGVDYRLAQKEKRYENDDYAVYTL